MGTIFVADASPGARERTAACLEGRHHRVLGFATLSALQQELLRRQPDLVILEARLPDGDGFQWARRFKEQAPIPIVFVSDCDSPSDRIRGFEAGADDYVMKPFSGRELALRVDAILRGYAGRRTSGCTEAPPRERLK